MSFEKAKSDLEEKGLGDHVIVLNESSATVTGDSDRTARAIAAQVGAHPAFPRNCCKTFRKSAVLPSARI